MQLCRGLKTLQQTCDKNMKLSDQERNLCHLSEELNVCGLIVCDLHRAAHPHLVYTLTQLTDLP